MPSSADPATRFPNFFSRFARACVCDSRHSQHLERRLFSGRSHTPRRAAMTALEKKPVTVKDVGLVQGLLVVAAQLKKYGRDGLDTNGACAAAPSLQLRCRLSRT